MNYIDIIILFIFWLSLAPSTGQKFNLCDILVYDRIPEKIITFSCSAAFWVYFQLAVVSMLTLAFCQSTALPKNGQYLYLSFNTFRTTKWQIKARPECCGSVEKNLKQHSNLHAERILTAVNLMEQLCLWASVYSAYLKHVWPSNLFGLKWKPLLDKLQVQIFSTGCIFFHFLFISFI